MYYWSRHAYSLNLYFSYWCSCTAEKQNKKNMIEKLCTREGVYEDIIALLLLIGVTIHIPLCSDATSEASSTTRPSTATTSDWQQCRHGVHRPATRWCATSWRRRRPTWCPAACWRSGPSTPSSAPQTTGPSGRRWAAVHFHVTLWEDIIYVMFFYSWLASCVYRILYSSHYRKLQDIIYVMFCRLASCVHRILYSSHHRKLQDIIYVMFCRLASCVYRILYSSHYRKLQDIIYVMFCRLASCVCRILYSSHYRKYSVNSHTKNNQK